MDFSFKNMTASLNVRLTIRLLQLSAQLSLSLLQPLLVF